MEFQARAAPNRFDRLGCVRKLKILLRIDLTLTDDLP